MENIMDLMTAQETATILRTTTAALAAHRHRGTGPDFVRAGRRILYRRGAVESWLRDVKGIA